MVKSKHNGVASAALRIHAHRPRYGMIGPAARPSRPQSTDDFDAAAWFAVIEEQKRAIARAAGVDPSRVRIQIGH